MFQVIVTIWGYFTISHTYHSTGDLKDLYSSYGEQLILQRTVHRMLFLRVAYCSLLVASHLIYRGYILFHIKMARDQIIQDTASNTRLDRLPIVRSFIDSKSKAYAPSEHEDNLNDVCAICIENFHVTDNLIIVLDCDGKHTFHSKCLKIWALKNDTCPMCREPIMLEE